VSERLYGRSTQLFITSPSGVARSYSGITPAALARVEEIEGQIQIINPEQSKDVFRIAFNVELNSEGNVNIGKVSIYNLNATSRSFIEQDKIKIVLMAGYGPNPQIIFSGEVDGDKTKSEKSGPDLITTIESGDGRLSLNNTVLNKTFAPGVSIDQVLKDIAKEMQIPSKIQDLSPEKFAQGLSISSSPAEVLDNLTKKQDLEWSIQAGILEIKKKNRPISTEKVVISPETGLVSIPKKLTDGIEFVSLLNPLIRPGRPVQIESKFLKGEDFFIVRKVQHQGDNFSGPWNSFVEAAAPKALRTFAS
jgi:hypothetical protein